MTGGAASVEAGKGEVDTRHSQRATRKKFAQHAVTALRIVVAPHFPAQPQALVCGDVLSQLDETARDGRKGETVRKIFAAVDAQFASAPQVRADWLALQPDLMAVLHTLEEKL